MTFKTSRAFSTEHNLPENPVRLSSRKIAIVGSATASLSSAPWEDRSWEIWALGYERRRVDRYFELHPDHTVKPELRDYYKDIKQPLYVHQVRDDWPTCVLYPKDEIEALVLTNEFRSSPAWMMALAIFEKADEIGLWGIELLCESEYESQRQNLYYFIGLARGLGINVHIPPQSSLLKANFQYGISEPATDEGPIKLEYIEKRLAYLDNIERKIHADMDKGNETLLKIFGARQELLVVRDGLRHYLRGGIAPGGK